MARQIHEFEKEVYDFLDSQIEAEADSIQIIGYSDGLVFDVFELEADKRVLFNWKKVFRKGIRARLIEFLENVDDYSIEALTDPC